MSIIAYFATQIKVKILKRIIIITLLLAYTGVIAIGQDIDKRKYIQIDGMTLDDSGEVIPNVGIYSFKLQRGASSDTRGIFSIISTPGDTVFFTLPGYKPTLLTIPAQLQASNYITDIHIVKDTITLEEVIVLPWKTYSEFKKAVANAKADSPETENMHFNIALIKQQINDDLNAKPGEGYRYTMQQMSDNLYTRGQFPANNLLNPIAWTRFIKGIRNGLLRNDDHHKKSTYTRSRVRKKKIK